MTSDNCKEVPCFGCEHCAPKDDGVPIDPLPGDDGYEDVPR